MLFPLIYIVVNVHWEDSLLAAEKHECTIVEALVGSQQNKCCFCMLWVNEAQRGCGAQNRCDGGRHLSLWHMSCTSCLLFACLKKAGKIAPVLQAKLYAETLRIRKTVPVTGAGRLREWLL